MSLFQDEDVLTKEIETWRGFIDKLTTDEDIAVLRVAISTSARKLCLLFEFASNEQMLGAGNQFCNQACHGHKETGLTTQS